MPQENRRFEPAERLLHSGRYHGHERSSPIGRSVADGEAGVLELRLLQLLDKGHGIVFVGDFAIACAVCDEVVLAETEIAGAFAPGNDAGSREIRPVD